MRDFGRDNRGGGGRDFGRGGGDRHFGGGSRGGDRQMFKAICSNCGRECEVPFKPNGSKPVLCNDCFRKADGGAGRSDSRAPRPSFSSPRPEGGNRDQFEALNSKLDKILRLLEQQAPQKSQSPAREQAVVSEENAATPLPFEANVEAGMDQQLTPDAEIVVKKKRAPKKKTASEEIEVVEEVVAPESDSQESPKE